MAQQTAQVTVRGTPENPIFDFVLPTGAKGEPGGWTQGVALGNENLNDVTTPGLYKTGSPTNTTVANNYPPMTDWGGSARTTLEVVVWGGSSPAVIQRLTRIGHTGGRAQVMYTRMRDGTTWSPWQTFSPQRVDDTAGKSIYTWDDVNNREQLIYGDTGVRNIISSISGQSTLAADPSVLLHRYGNLVTLVFENLQPAVSADWSPFLSLPTGFRPRLRNPHRFFVVATNLGEQRSLFLYTSGAMTIFGAKTTDVIRATLTYPTIDPWPTSLPGVAI